MEVTSIEKEDEKIYNNPQKWFVRKKWLTYVKKRKDILGRQPKIFTLTSTGIYDIKYLRDNGLISLKGNLYDKENLAFCEKAHHRHALIKLKLPGAKSHLVTFEDLVTSHDATISGTANKWFPFDVINLDFNESMFKREKVFFNIFRKLFTIQNLKKNSFTLFLTINLISEDHHSSNKSTLDKLREDNIKSEELQGIKDKLINIKFESYVQYISSLVPKFIVEEGFKHNFEVSIKENMNYIGDGNKTRISSFVFDIEHHGNPMVTLPSVRNEKLLEIVNEPLNVNNIIESDSQLKKQMEDLVDKYKITANS